jgi:acetyl esterase/lipase
MHILNWLRRRWLVLVLLLLLVSGIYLATTNNPHIWPLRNIAAYRVAQWWEQRTPAQDHEPVGTGSLRGCVSDSTGAVVSGATVLVSEPDGTTHHDTTGADGCYSLDNLPAGRYVPVAGADGYASAMVRHWGMALRVHSDQQYTQDISLPPRSLPTVTPGTNLRIDDPTTVSWPLPEPAEATRRELHYRSGNRPNQPTWLYTPTESSEPLPTLLAVYPGPADTWEGVSVPLAAAGYAVIAVGPSYSFEPEKDIDELQRLIDFARAGALPATDGQRIAVLGGSYSGMHAMRLVQRDAGLQGVVLLGPPSDLFDMRRRFEEGSISPPFGLDQALIALGWPNTNPGLYWRYSARFHLRSDLPPVLLMHSRDDDIVPFQQSEILARELEQAGILYEAFFFDGMSHYLLADEPSEQLDQLYEMTITFLDEVMQQP